MGYSPWGHKKSDTTERLSTAQTACPRGLHRQSYVDMHSRITVCRIPNPHTTSQIHIS